MPKNRIAKFFNEIEKLSTKTESTIFNNSDSFMTVVLCIARLENQFTAKDLQQEVIKNGKNISIQHLYRIINKLIQSNLLKKSVTNSNDAFIKI